MADRRVIDLTENELLDSLLKRLASLLRKTPANDGGYMDRATAERDLVIGTSQLEKLMKGTDSRPSVTIGVNRKFDARALKTCTGATK